MSPSCVERGPVERVPGPGRSRLFLVSCVSAKRPHPAPARDLYVSPLFLKARDFVEGSGCPWFILSAEHALLPPETVIAPYERTLNAMPVQHRRAWAERVLAALWPRLSGVEAVVFFAGQRYREFLQEPLRSRVAVEVPLAGMRIGEQLHWFVEQARRL